MTFPATVPANHTFHKEGNQFFHVKSGRWLRHRHVEVFEAGGQNVTIPGTARHRVTINSVFKTNGNGPIRFNMTDAADSWLPMSRWTEGAGQLMSGGSSWRSGDWKSLNVPTSAGYYLTWPAGTDWYCDDNTYCTSEINIVDTGIGGQSVVNWTLMGKKPGGTVFTTRGNVSIDVNVSWIRHIALNAGVSGFRVINHHLEVV